MTNAFNIKPYTYDESNFMNISPEMPSDQSGDDMDRKPEGVLPVAILGLEDFDVREVLPETILLNGVPPVRWEYEDVATPAGTEDGYCGCNTERGDGFEDLTLKFKAEEIVAASDLASAQPALNEFKTLSEQLGNVAPALYTAAQATVGYPVEATP